MLPENTFLLVLCFITFICLLLFLLPVYFIWFHPRFDDEDIRRINNIGMVILCLPVLVLVFIRMFIHIWEISGSVFQGIASIAMVILMTGIVAAYSRFTGIQAHVFLGMIAGLVFSGIWLYTGDLRLATGAVVIGIVALILIFICTRYTRRVIDLSSNQLMNYSLLGFSVIMAVLLAYYTAHGDAGTFVGFFSFCMIYLGVRYAVRSLAITPDNKQENG